MHKWTKHSPHPRRIALLLFDRFSNHCLANALEPFRAANALAGQTLYEWSLCSMTGEPVRASSGITLLPDMALNELKRLDFLFVITSYGYEEINNATNRIALRKAATQSDVVAGLDTGAWLLAASGLLNDHRSTIHWDVLETYAEVFLETDVLRERFVIDNDRITCAGATAAFDLILHLIGQDHGEKLRLDVEALFMKTTASDAPVSEITETRSPIVTRAMALMQENLETPISIKNLARSLGCSQKELERRFNADLGVPPTQVYRHFRLSAIKRLIETTSLPISEIALRGGYENASAMTRAFVREFNQTPRDIRLQNALSDHPSVSRK